MKSLFVRSSLVSLIASGVAFAAPIAAPDMGDATTSMTNVFGAVMILGALYLGFKYVRKLVG